MRQHSTLILWEVRKLSTSAHELLLAIFGHLRNESIFEIIFHNKINVTNHKYF